jgi:hypothetical protein
MFIYSADGTNLMVIHDDTNDRITNSTRSSSSYGYWPITEFGADKKAVHSNIRELLNVIDKKCSVM